MFYSNFLPMRVDDIVCGESLIPHIMEIMELELRIKWKLQN